MSTAQNAPKLTKEEKKHVWGHLVGNFVTMNKTTAKQWAAPLLDALKNPDPTKKYMMDKYIQTQVEELPNREFVEKLTRFKEECKDKIAEFNDEYKKLMEAISTENLSELSIEDRMQALETKWRSEEFA